MKIAVTYENGEIFGHFGHTKHQQVLDLKDQNQIRRIHQKY